MDDEYVKQSLIAMVKEDQTMRERALRKEAPWDDNMDERHTHRLKK